LCSCAFYVPNCFCSVSITGGDIYSDFFLNWIWSIDLEYDSHKILIFVTHATETNVIVWLSILDNFTAWCRGTCPDGVRVGDKFPVHVDANDAHTKLNDADLKMEVISRE
jgi:hypothetical protein